MENKLAKVSVQNLHTNVEFLTTVNPPRNFSNPAVLDKVAEFIYNKFENYGCRTSYQTYYIDGITYRNVIGSIGPEEGERIVIGAHYDVAGDQPGADDNASAVAGLLESARILTLQEGELLQRIDFVAFTLEEPPYFGTSRMGSAVHAKSLHERGVEVKYMLCYEMIGYFSEEPGSQQFPYPELASKYPDKGNFITVVGIEKYYGLVEDFYTAMKKYGNLPIERIALPQAEGLAGMSDQRNFWRYGYPAIMINDTSFLRNPNYHLATDTIDTLDFEKMAEVVNGVNGAVFFGV
jgi:Zn-dependent M28 family amino/carboxypeptidase